jgi:hypothetical protein
MNSNDRKPSDPDQDIPMTEQRRAYARLLDVLVRIGLVLVIVSSAPFAAGLLPLVVPLGQAPELWSLPVHEYLSKTGMDPLLWSLSVLLHGDTLPLVGIAFLALATILCYLRIIPIFGRTRNVPYLLIAIGQVLLLLFAASGLV